MPMCSFVSLAALLQKLPLNKSPGPDCISAKHLLYADESLRFFLSELFNMCIVHGYIPNSCLNTTIVPICKKKNGNMSDTSNYRPVAVATVVSKLLEHFILSYISPFLGTTDNQFGFKAGHSTDQCTFLLKQTASYFVTHGWFICACCVFRCLESIRSSTTHEIIWETNSKKGANVFCAPTETLVQRTNDANKVGQAFFWTVSCV